MKHFKKEEMARCFRGNGERCPECPLKQQAEKLPERVVENMKALVEQVLEPARQKLGKPITVNSGFRCQIHNRNVGGVANSQHLRGEAADICCKENKKLEEILTKMGNYDQLIIYPTFIHVSYKKDGVNRKKKFYKS